MQPIHIIGGGLAGLALGIGLRERGVPTRITEAGMYPRHRVCGEFISGRGVDLLRQLAGEELLAEAQARLAHTVAFFLKSRCLGTRELPRPALCVSRYALDALLARRFCERGGELQLRTRATDGAAGSPTREGVVLATGRRRQPVDEQGWRWFGLKAHFSGVAMAADLEMHLDTHSYVGICKLAADVVNVCGLFRSREGGEHPNDSLAVLRGAPGSLLHERLRIASVHEDSMCAVAGLSLRQIAPPAANECRVGDAWSMIPPITGNGMSMAFECATLAAGPLQRYAQGQARWAEAADQVQVTLRQTFGTRLRWANILHRVIFTISRWGRLAAPLYTITWRPAFALTR